MRNPSPLPANSEKTEHPTPIRRLPTLVAADGCLVISISKLNDDDAEPRTHPPGRSAPCWARAEPGWGH